MDDSSNFESKFKEVSGWLEQVFEGESFPEYEINQQTVFILHSFVTLNKEIEKVVNILINDINRKREEYEAKALNCTQKLSNVGLSITSLSQASLRNLSTLSEVALCLKVKDCNYSSFALAMTDVSNKIEECFSETKSQDTAVTHLKVHINEIRKEKNNLESSLDVLHLQSITEQPILEKRANDKKFLKVKANEYHNIITDIESVNHKRGVCKSLFHNTLKMYHKEYMDICSEINKLKSALSYYHNLPPDMSLARVKIAEARQELQELESELYNNLEVLNL